MCDLLVFAGKVDRGVGVEPAGDSGDLAPTTIGQLECARVASHLGFRYAHGPHQEVLAALQEAFLAFYCEARLVLRKRKASVTVEVASQVVAQELVGEEVRPFVDRRFPRMYAVLCETFDQARRSNLECAGVLWSREQGVDRIVASQRVAQAGKVLGVSGRKLDLQHSGVVLDYYAAAAPAVAKRYLQSLFAPPAAVLVGADDLALSIGMTAEKTHRLALDPAYLSVGLGKYGGFLATVAPAGAVGDRSVLLPPAAGLGGGARQVAHIKRILKYPA